jgi:transcriptional regulator with XRE-family HTH domain
MKSARNDPAAPALSYVSLQEALRRELRKRVESGELTGVELARRTGFTQAHISNFLNRKRGLKLGALDRALRAIGLTLYDLLDPRDLARFAALPPATAGADSAEVPEISAEAAARREVIVREDVRAMLRYPISLLDALRPYLAAPARRTWTRFIALRVGEPDAAAMAPRLAAGAVLLVDRHYTALEPYRAGARNLCAVRRTDSCAVRYVEAAGASLVLRPHSPDFPVEVVTPADEQALSSLVVGRVAHLSENL